MASTTKLPIAEPSPVPASVTVELRGRRYTVTELEISEYDKLVRQATKDDVDEDGNAVEITDNTLLMRLMIVKAVSPKLTAEEIAGMGTRMYRQLARIINELHYGDEPVKIIGEDEVDDLDAKEETTSGKD